MSNYTVANIIKDVRLDIDEIALNDADFLEQDDEELDAVIKSKIGEAINFIHGNAQVELMDASSFTLKEVEASSATVTNGVETITVDDVLRPIWLRLSSWGWAISKFVSYADEESTAPITDVYSGANYMRPAVIVKGINGSNNKNQITFYCYRTKVSDVAEKVEIRYVPYTKIDNSTLTGTSTISIDERLYRATINYIAGLTLITYNDKERAQELIEIAMSECGMVDTKSGGKK